MWTGIEYLMRLVSFLRPGALRNDLSMSKEEI